MIPQMTPIHEPERWMAQVRCSLSLIEVEISKNQFHNFAIDDLVDLQQYVGPLFRHNYFIESKDS